MVDDLPSTSGDEELPELPEATIAPKGIRFIAARIKKWTERRQFFDLISGALAQEQPKLLTYAGHGSVTLLHSDLPLG